jgi:hypothetical protein
VTSVTVRLRVLGYPRQIEIKEASMRFGIAATLLIVGLLLWATSSSVKGTPSHASNSSLAYITYSQSGNQQD